MLHEMDIQTGIDLDAVIRLARQLQEWVGHCTDSAILRAGTFELRERKDVPLLVGNIGPATFGQDDNALLLVDAQGHRELPRASKEALGHQLVAEIARRLAAV